MTCYCSGRLREQHINCVMFMTAGADLSQHKYIALPRGTLNTMELQT
jgi:hypothetical protein